MSDEEKRPLYRWSGEDGELVEVVRPPITPPLPKMVAKEPPRLLPSSQYTLLGFERNPRGAYVWHFDEQRCDFFEMWSEDGPEPEYGYYATRREAQIGYLKSTVRESGVLTPSATLVLITLLDELNRELQKSESD